MRVIQEESWSPVKFKSLHSYIQRYKSYLETLLIRLVNFYMIYSPFSSRLVRRRIYLKIIAVLALSLKKKKKKMRIIFECVSSTTKTVFFMKPLHNPFLNHFKNKARRRNTGMGS